MIYRSAIMELERGEVARNAAGLAAGVAGVVSVWAGFIAVRGGWRLFMRWVRLWIGFGRWWYLAGTLRLLRRCPDCRRIIRRDARVCRHCGWRRVQR
jgi:hypothetical protein